MPAPARPQPLRRQLSRGGSSSAVGRRSLLIPQAVAHLLLSSTTGAPSSPPLLLAVFLLCELLNLRRAPQSRDACCSAQRVSVTALPTTYSGPRPPLPHVSFSARPPLRLGQHVSDEDKWGACAYSVLFKHVCELCVRARARIPSSTHCQVR